MGRLHQRHRNVLSAAFALAVSITPRHVWAGPDDAIVLPTVARQKQQLVRPDPDTRIGRAAETLDQVVLDAVQDLGLKVDLDPPPIPKPRELREEALVRRARESWVVSPRVEGAGRRIRVRIVVVPPGSEIALSRADRFDSSRLDVEPLRMVRDLVEHGRQEPDPSDVEDDVPAPPVVSRTRSEGRAVLALSSAAFGGYVGFTIERVSQSNDERVLFPLVALGTGLGLGASMIVADEWDISTGEAWYLAAGTWWATSSGILITRGYDSESEGNRYAIGLGAGVGGLTLATAGLYAGDIGEGGALLAHSGGAFGSLFGALTEMSARGETGFVPYRGLGYGAGVGVLVGATVATQFEPRPSRVLLVDLSATLGALAGAAVGSPLVFEDDPSEARIRGWLGSIATGTLAGAVVGTLVTRPDPVPRAGIRWEPPVVGRLPTEPGGSAWGMALRGRW